MKLKILLATGTATGLLMSGAAFAGSANHVYLTQDGSNNSASIEQNAGPGGNDFGLTGNWALQKGSNNRLVEDQQTGGGFSRGNNDTLVFLQQGDNNTASTVYNNNAGGNIINEVKQVGNFNWFANTRNASVDGTIGTVHQTGNYNSAAIGQSGTGNAVILVQQLGNNNGYYGGAGGPQNYYAWGTLINQSGNNNLITESTIDGDNNGTGNNSTWGPVHRINQNGNGNGSSLSIARTVGSNNNLIHVSETGNNNQFSIVQGVTRASEHNKATLTQLGDDNIGTGIQAGSENTMAVTQTGNGNFAAIAQYGDHNIATAAFSGDNNGVGSLTGVAGGLDGTSALLNQGSIYQDSGTALLGNSADYTVIGSNNKFAFAQIGSSNTIVGTVGVVATPSANNQVAVLQNGTGNTAGFTQIGAGSNNAAITQ